MEQSVGGAANKLKTSLEKVVEAADNRIAHLAPSGGARRGGYVRMGSSGGSWMRLEGAAGELQQPVWDEDGSQSSSGGGAGE
jgi:hypothetical protein